MTQSPLHILRAFASALLLVGAIDAAQPDDPVAATGIEQGLYIVIGSTDGALEATIATRGQGRILVQGVTVDRAGAERFRAQMAKRGLAGLASVVWVPDLASLPYNDHLANVAVADLDAAGAPTLEEVTRIVRPLGVLWVRRKGAWSAIRKPMPAEMDEWTHYDHGPDGNPQSNDALAGPIKGIQWIAGNGGGTGRSTTRLADGRWIKSERISAPYLGPEYLWSRDAFNGMLCWRIEEKGIERGPQDSMLVAGDGIVAGVIGEPGPARIIDAATGKTLRVVSNGLEQPEKARYPSISDTVRRIALQQIMTGGVLYQTYEDRMVAVKVADGTRLWDYTAPSGRFIAFIVSGEGKVFAGLSPGATRPMIAYGNQFSVLSEVVAFEAATGRQLWSTAIVGERDFTAFGIVYHDGGIFTVDAGYRRNTGKSSGYAKGAYGDLIRLNAKTGGIEFRRDLSAVEPKDDKWHHKLRVQNGQLVPAFDHVIRGFSTKTGADGTIFMRNVEPRTGEMIFCSVGRGTQLGQIGGKFARFADFKTGIYDAITVGRGACNEGMWPGYNMIYTGADGCGCSSFVRSTLALQCTQTTAAKPVPDAERIEKGVAATLGAPAGEADWPMLFADGARTSSTRDRGLKLRPGTKLTIGLTIDVPVAKPGGTIGSEWAEDNYRCGVISPPVIAGGLLVTASTDAQCVHGYDAATGALRWTWNAGSRVTSSPTLHRGLVLFGSQDGRVTALRADDGIMVWRTLIAPNRRQIVCSSQLESIWPVHGSVLVLADKIFAAAGRHNQSDGGIVLRRLDVATGAIEATTVIDSRNTSEAEHGITTQDWQGRLNDIPGTNAAGTLVYIGPMVIDPKSLAWVNLSVMTQPGAKTKNGAQAGGAFLAKGPNWSWATPDIRSFIFAPSTGTVDRRVTYSGQKGQNGYRFMASRIWSGGGYSGERIARDGRTLVMVRNNDLCSLVLNADWLPVDGSVTDIMEAHRAKPTRLAGIGQNVVALAITPDLVCVATNNRGDYRLIVRARDGASIGELKFRSPVVTHGISIAGGRLYVALENGQIHTVVDGG